MNTTTVPQAPTLAKGTRFAKLSNGRRLRVVHSTPCWTKVKFSDGESFRVRTASLHNDWVYTPY